MNKKLYITPETELHRFVMKDIVTIGGSENIRYDNVNGLDWSDNEDLTPMGD